MGKVMTEAATARQKPIEVGLVTADGAPMLSFYCDLLGFEPVAKIPFPGVGVVNRLSRGVSTLRILELEKPPAAAPVRGEFTATTGIRYLTVWLDDLDTTVSRCREQGHPIVVEPRELRPGVRVAMVTDPDGNTIEMMAES